MDYTFFGLGDDLLVVLTIREEESGAIEAAAVTEKGLAEAPVKIAIKRLEAWGLKRKVLVSDGEPAIQALLTAVKQARQDTVVTREARYDSKSKGLVENAHQLVQGLLRTWVASIEKRYQTTPSPSSCAMGCAALWMESHKIHYLGRGVGTAHRKLWGRKFGGSIAELGETVLFHVQGLNQEFPGRWEKAIWMGKMSLTHEHILGTPSGRQLARTVTQRLEHKIWSEVLFAQVVCTKAEPKLSVLPAVQAQRQVYLTRGIVERCGPHRWMQSVRGQRRCAHSRVQNQAGSVLDKRCTSESASTSSRGSGAARRGQEAQARQVLVIVSAETSISIKRIHARD